MFVGDIHVQCTCIVIYIVTSMQKVVELQQHVNGMEKVVQSPPDLNAEQVIDAALKLGMKPTTADFFHGQLKNCNRKDKG